MMNYSYVAINRAGEQITGEVEARSRDAVIGQLRQRGAFAVNVNECVAGQAGGKDASAGFAMFSRPPPPAQITMLTRELALLLRSGMALSPALQLLRKDAEETRMGEIIAGIDRRLNDGASFSEALIPAAGGRAFPRAYTSMVKVAEASGTLHKVLERIAEARERQQKLRAKIVSAMIYPALLIVTAIGAISLMLLFVVPQFKTMLESTGAQLPQATRSVIAVSDWFSANVGWLAAGLFGLIAAMMLARRSAPVQSALDALAFKLPLLGHAVRLNVTIQFSRSLGTLLENGVALPQALKLTGDVVTNRRAAGVIGEAHDALRKGQDFTQPLAGSGLILPVAVNMLKVGQETGSLAESALHLAVMCEDKLETAIARAFTILEPLIIIGVSLFVAGTIISIIGAVISVNDLAL